MIKLSHFLVPLTLLCITIAQILPRTSYAEETDKITKQWTLMVFMNGDNNLNNAGVRDLAEMQAVGSTSDINIVVLRDYGPKQSTKILYVNKGSSTVIYDFNKNLDTGDYNALINFFQFVKTNYPANHYLVDVWNHGGGWRERVNKGISNDDTSGHSISTIQLGQAADAIRAINNNKKVDILGMDACLMAMAEVIYEVKDSFNYVIASEETEPGDGWNYTSILNKLVANPAMSAEELSKEQVDSYIDDNDYYGVTQSAINVEKFVASIDTLKKYTARAKEIMATNKDAFIYARNNATSYDYREYKDMIGFMSIVNDKVSDQELLAISEIAIRQISDSIVASRHIGKDGSYGIAVWVPYSAAYYMNSYMNLKWAKDTGWSEIIKGML